MVKIQKTSRWICWWKYNLNEKWETQFKVFNSFKIDLKKKIEPRYHVSLFKRIIG
jgi:hypothetical protein